VRLDLGFDEVLTTTRAVRRRLDLERPVDRETIRECLRIAVQAPTGGSVERWKWLIVEDRATRAKVADLYRSATAESFQRSQETAPSEESRRAYAGALLLADVLDRVPVLVFPCMDGAPRAWTTLGAAAFYGSILPAVWSFQLALRSRGLGSTFTTAHLLVEGQIGEVLGIPDGVTQIAMLPVAHTIGDDFKPANRGAVEDVTFLDTWGERVAGWDSGCA
jgi:nitroreductase